MMPKSSKKLFVNLPQEKLLVRLLPGIPVDVGWGVVVEAGFPPTVYLGYHDLHCCLLLGRLLYLVYHYPYALKPPY
jgi:hypothetical protein